jgi:hypothetical protein
VVQLPGRELVEGLGDVGLGGIAQQDQDQVAVPAVAAIQSGASAPGGLGIGELATLRHHAHLRP